MANERVKELVVQLQKAQEGAAAAKTKHAETEARLEKLRSQDTANDSAWETLVEETLARPNVW